LTLEKSSGSAITTKKKYEIKSLPNYLFLKIERFGENNFFKEKNFTIVTFPLTGLDLTEFLPAGSASARYDLIGNVIHMGTA
jgi:U4/U6.U5 tri-snRNP-associated protein 2